MAHICEHGRPCCCKDAMRLEADILWFCKCDCEDDDEPEFDNANRRIEPRDRDEEDRRDNPLTALE